jgi:hypothetical protein
MLVPPPTRKTDAGVRRRRPRRTVTLLTRSLVPTGVCVESDAMR